ncbi:MAG: hypothetical protein AAF702_04280 [Chloroflexota bacterium]
MKKSSKQKNNKRQAKQQRRQQRQLKQQAKHDEQSADSPDDAHPMTAAQRRKTLMAQFRQNQWNQKVQAGKAAGARVEKRFNRGG